MNGQIQDRTSRIADVHVYGSEERRCIRCKVDGVWQGGKVIRPTDRHKAMTPEGQRQLAEEYFVREARAVKQHHCRIRR